MLGLAQRGLRYVVQVDPDSTAHPSDAVPVTTASAGRGCPPRPAHPDPPSTFKQLVLAPGRDSARPVTWRHGSRRTKNNPTAAMRSHFLRLRIRPANRDITRNDDGTLPECRLIAEWPTAADEPVKYRLSNMSTRTSLRTVIRHAKLRWRVEHHYRELKPVSGRTRGSRLASRPPCLLHRQPVERPRLHPASVRLPATPGDLATARRVGVGVLEYPHGHGRRLPRCMLRFVHLSGLGCVRGRR